MIDTNVASYIHLYRRGDSQGKVSLIPNMRETADIGKTSPLEFAGLQDNDHAHSYWKPERIISLTYQRDAQPERVTARIPM